MKFIQFMYVTVLGFSVNNDTGVAADDKAPASAADTIRLFHTLRTLSTVTLSANALSDIADDNHMQARGVGVHSVLNGRLHDHDQEPNNDQAVTRDENQEIRKARITVVVACIIALISTVLFTIYIYCRTRSKRLTKVRVSDIRSNDRKAILT